MTTITWDSETSVGALASDHPELIPWLHAQNIEFCCGGSQTIGALCRTRGISLEDFGRDLEARAKQTEASLPTWQDGEEPALIEFILDRFHAGHRREFPTLKRMMEKVCRVHGEKWPALAEVSDLLDALIEDVEPHMQKEERVLFPLILHSAGEEVDEPFPSINPLMPIAVMRHEHEHVGAILARLSSLTDGYSAPDWACNTLRGLLAGLSELESELKLHIHLENNALFPMVERQAERA